MTKTDHVTRTYTVYYTPVSIDMNCRDKCTNGKFVMHSVVDGLGSLECSLHFSERRNVFHVRRLHKFVKLLCMHI